MAISWRKHRAYRKAIDLGQEVGMVSRNASGWLASYRRQLLGQFPGVDEAVAAVEERHQGPYACE